jgi:histidyl-tRNA synthetase
MEKPTGFKDYSIEETIIRKQLIEKIENVFRLFGFMPMEQIIMEKTNVLFAKSGDAIKDEVFLIKNEDVGLRFDLTLGMARYIASKRDLVKPIKRYIIEKVWRNEEAQKGRLREFLQADIDIIGVKEETAELEILKCLSTALDTLNLNYEILLNSRDFLDKYADENNIKNKQEVFRIIDKSDKIEERELIKQLEAMNAKPFIELIEKDKKLANEEKISLIKDYSEDFKVLSFLLQHFPNAKIKLSLVRGLDYYNRTIFEFKDESNLTIAAGGRYDNLLSIFGQGDFAIGGSIGFDRIWSLKREMFMKNTKKWFVYIINFPETLNASFEIAEKLRRNNIACDVNLTKRHISKQLEYANALNISHVIIVGKKELQEGKIKIRNMESGEEKILSIDETIKFFRMMKTG